MTRRQLAVPVAILILLGLAAAALFAMGRHPICTCGYVALFHGALDAGNSQHLLDWYSLSHVGHGLIFYGLGALLLRRLPRSSRLLVAVVIEAGWELVENSPAVIERYRTATIALGYTGDSIVNLMSDILCMIAGFALARALPVIGSVIALILLELTALAMIRDNLTLNILMLLWPIEAVRRWQGL